jgi:hypothetical protein
MATRRTTFGKQERERAKKAKAAAKRDRRLEANEETASPDDGEGPPPVQHDKESIAELFAAIDQLHRRFEAQEIEHREFEKQKVELLAKLPID